MPDHTYYMTDSLGRIVGRVVLDTSELPDAIMDGVQFGLGGSWTTTPERKFLEFSVMPVPANPTVEPEQLNVSQIDLVVEALNRIHKMDPQILPKLIMYHVPTTKAVADHPTIPVHLNKNTTTYTVGLLGIINGIIKRRLDERNVFVAAEFNGFGELIEFKRLEV